MTQFVISVEGLQQHNNRKETQAMWQKIKNWWKGLFSKEKGEEAKVTVQAAVVKTASETLDAFINNPENQKAAVNAISAVAKTGAKNNQALNDAVNILKANGLAAGQAAANTLLRTLVQVVYAMFKVK